MVDGFPIAIENLIRMVPEGWLADACEALRGVQHTAGTKFVLDHLPETNNADLSLVMGEVVQSASGKMSWEALSWVLTFAFTTYHSRQTEQRIEFLWSGPLPANQIPARRIDQAIYDLVANAKREILLVTFAAAKIERLTGELLKAAQAGVKIQLVLEFEQSSEGQLSFDALNAFPTALINACEIYHWPVEKRERNQAGRPGKLHAKMAIVDDVAVVSSANLTDDAFNRNLEVGIMVRNPEFLASAKTYFKRLISEGTLSRMTA